MSGPSPASPPPPVEWRPSASFAALAGRARLLAEVRAFFAERGVLEVETPVLAQAPVTDVHLASLSTRVAGLPGPCFLQTSPEYAMKRLLAAGAPDLYQVARVFRDGERGSHHNPEFTLVEWYRRGFDDGRLMDEVAALLARLLGPRLARPSERLAWREAFVRELGADPHASSPAALQALAAARLGLAPASFDDRDTLLDLLMGAVVGPALGRGGITFVTDWPASQSALARLRPSPDGTGPVAARFEAYVEGVELCNGFHELCDAAEQRRRFDADRAARTARGLPVPPVDERLLAALAHGLPDCAGVALGFDRVVMLALGARSIREVLAFPVEIA